MKTNPLLFQTDHHRQLLKRNTETAMATAKKTNQSVEVKADTGRCLFFKLFSRVKLISWIRSMSNPPEPDEFKNGDVDGEALVE